MKQTAVKRWGSIGILIVAAIGILGLYAVKMARPAAPFAFLAGVKPVPGLHYALNSIEYIDGVGYTNQVFCYNVPTDYDTVRAQAGGELMAKGFAGEAVENTFLYRGDSRYSEIVNASEFVCLYKDKCFRPGLYNPLTPSVTPTEEQPGWTGVQICVCIRQSPFEVFWNQCQKWIPHPAGPQPPGGARR